MSSSPPSQHGKARRRGGCQPPLLAPDLRRSSCRGVELCQAHRGLLAVLPCCIAKTDKRAVSKREIETKGRRRLPVEERGARVGVHGGLPGEEEGHLPKLEGLGVVDRPESPFATSVGKQCCRRRRRHESELRASAGGERETERLGSGEQRASRGDDGEQQTRPSGQRLRQ
nr:unnamed protein product [Digitaria exilis]